MVFFNGAYIFTIDKVKIICYTVPKQGTYMYITGTGYLNENRRQKNIRGL